MHPRGASLVTFTDVRIRRPSDSWHDKAETPRQLEWGDDNEASAADSAGDRGACDRAGACCGKTPTSLSTRECECRRLWRRSSIALCGLLGRDLCWQRSRPASPRAVADRLQSRRLRARQPLTSDSTVISARYRDDWTPFLSWPCQTPVGMMGRSWRRKRSENKRPQVITGKDALCSSSSDWPWMRGIKSWHACSCSHSLSCAKTRWRWRSSVPLAPMATTDMTATAIAGGPPIPAVAVSISSSSRWISRRTSRPDDRRIDAIADANFNAWVASHCAARVVLTRARSLGPTTPAYFAELGRLLLQQIRTGRARPRSRSSQLVDDTARPARVAVMFLMTVGRSGQWLR